MSEGAGRRMSSWNVTVGYIPKADAGINDHINKVIQARDSQSNSDIQEPS